MLKHMVDLDDEDLALLDDVLEDGVEIAVAVLEMHIESDQTPETVEEFMAVVSDQQDRVAALKNLQQRLRRHLGRH